ncbi:MAG: hypothetical protein JXR51_03575 [Bacteroidales bacterium]|nr:hypothetical protein [Bacteroidales bacterium]MBN2756233.1 hypothetical protein [Bacteroidales bacterium]
MKKFYSNGKFLITAEYLVMKGALALALPLKFGQRLKIEENNLKNIIWQTDVIGNIWFKAELDENFNILHSTNSNIADFLENILKSAKKLNNKFVIYKGTDLIADVNFDINWGFGSSSTLISNIAYLADINPFSLFNIVANGSAYDIACARKNSPIKYKLINNIPEYQNVTFNPNFKDKLFFAYLGNKQNSEKSIKDFKQNSKFSESLINEISDITNKFIEAENIIEFSELMHKHEEIIGSILKRKTVKKEFFSDFEGEIKSLGAWGGDFVMIASEMPFKYIKNYFLEKGINVIFKYDDIVLNK